MQTLATICFVIPYFGKWPLWMPLFLESCRKNSTVNWRIYTDCGVPVDCPDNVLIHAISFDDYCALVTTRLAIDFKPESAYKLCDIKPALGYIHAQDLAAYDFWAFGDIDVVYGDLRSYFTQSKLQQKDLFSTHARRISGHLCLIRNTAEMNSAFMRVRDWQQLLSAQQHVAFDEKAFSKLFLRHKNSTILRQISMMFDVWLRRAEFVEAFSTPNAKIKWIDGSQRYPTTWYWNNGVLTNDMDGEKTFPYFHFMVWKQSWADMKLGAVEGLAHMPRIQAFSLSVSAIQYTLAGTDTAASVAAT